MIDNSSAAQRKRLAQYRDEYLAKARILEQRAAGYTRPDATFYKAATLEAAAKFRADAQRFDDLLKALEIEYPIKEETT